MLRILITGGSGFIGRNLRESLQEDHVIYFPVHGELDLLDSDALSRYVYSNKIDIVIHCAIHVGMFHGYENLFFNDILMFINIEKISHLVQKVIYFGSGAEYDKSRDISMVKEEDIGERIPAADYGLAKYTMNKIAVKSDNIYNLRLFGIFGKYELWDIKFISNIICKAMYALPLTIRKECVFDFLYVKDLPGIVRWFIYNEPKFHDYNVCMGIPYRLSEIANIVKNISKKDIDIHFLDMGMGFEYTGDNKRLLFEVKDLSITSMEQAVADLYRYYRDHKEEIDYEKLKKSR